MGALEDARRAYKVAFDAAQRIDDPAARAYAFCGWGRLQATSGNFPDGKRIIEAGIAELSEDPRFAAPAASCLMDQATVIGFEGDADGQARAAERALARLAFAPTGYEASRANAQTILAMARERQGRTTESEREYGKAMEQLKHLGRAETTTGATLLNGWAVLRSNAGDMLGALELQKRSTDLMENSTRRGNEGRILLRLGRAAEAADAYRRSVALAETEKNLRAMATGQLGIARVCRAVEDLPCARAALDQAEPLLKKVMAPGHFFLADLAHEQAFLALAEGDHEKARTLLDESLAIHAKVPQKHMSHIETLLEASRFALTSGNIDEAERHARDALTLANELRGDRPTSSWVGLSELALGHVARARGNAVEARTRFQAAASNLEPTYGASHRATEEARAALAALR
jgi:tetratricopeptide (TPR) repeat protein